MIEAVLIVLLIATRIYLNPLPAKDLSDYLVIVLVFSLPTIVCINSANNILLINTLGNRQKNTRSRAWTFWIISILFLMVICLIGLLFYVTYTNVISTQPDDKLMSKNMMTEYLVILLLLGIIAMNGVALFIAQIVLFREIKKQGKNEELEMVETIGAES
ncbi:MAG: hypothetical protein QM791_11835 [Ferruginibacter sp.]